MSEENIETELRRKYLDARICIRVLILDMEKERKIMEEVTSAIENSFSIFEKDGWNWHGQDRAGYRDAVPYVSSIDIYAEDEFSIDFGFSAGQWNHNRDAEDGWEDIEHSFRLVMREYEAGIWSQKSWDFI